MLGSIVERVCDAAGLPEWLGDVASIATDCSTGNWVGVAHDALDLAENAGVRIDPLLPEPLARAGLACLESSGQGALAGLAVEQLISTGLRA